MRLPLDGPQKIKTYIHAFQSLILFLALVLTVAVFTRDGSSDARLGWYFGLCWLTIPILIYLVMVPMWSRANKFSNVYAFATVDILSIILWLSAWASTASYVASGKSKGDKKGASGCDNFKYGSPGRCKLSTGVTFLGLFMMLAFCGTAYFSFRAAMHFNRTGTMPNQPVSKNEFAVQTEDAFSSDVRNDDFDEERQGVSRHSYPYQQPVRDEDYAPVYQHDHDDLGNGPHEPISPLGRHGLGLGASRYDHDTSYHGVTIRPDHDPLYDQPPAYGR